MRKIIDRSDVLVKQVNQTGKIRVGRGFSLKEFKAAGIGFQYANGLALPLDKRRNSCHEDNVNFLKEYFAEQNAPYARLK